MKTKWVGPTNLKHFLSSSASGVLSYLISLGKHTKFSVPIVPSGKSSAIFLNSSLSSCSSFFFF